jgi:DNA-binding GntR family transcriptional regulator
MTGKGKHRRGGPVPEGSKATRRLTTGPSLADQAYDALREDITSGRLGAETRITERWLAARLGVSPTPVREALKRLEHEHLIERTGSNSIRVAEPSLRRLHELSLTEAALRGVAAQIAAVAASDDELAALSALCDQIEKLGSKFNSDAKVREKVLRLTREFHLLVDKASHNPTLINMIATATAFDWNFRKRFAPDIYADKRVSMEAHLQHREILEALLARDGELAGEKMRRHILKATEAFMAVVGNASDETASA